MIHVWWHISSSATFFSTSCNVTRSHLHKFCFLFVFQPRSGKISGGQTESKLQVLSEDPDWSNEENTTVSSITPQTRHCFNMKKLSKLWWAGGETVERKLESETKTSKRQTAEQRDASSEKTGRKRRTQTNLKSSFGQLTDKKSSSSYIDQQMIFFTLFWHFTGR